MPTTASNALQPPTRKLVMLSATVKNTTSETTAQSTRDHASTLVEHVTDQMIAIVTSVSTTLHLIAPTSVLVTLTGLDQAVMNSQANVTQSAIKKADVTDTLSVTVNSASPTPIVLTTVNAYVTKTGAERTAPSTQVSVTQSVRNVTDQRPVTVSSVLAMPTVMLREPAAVSTTGQAPTVASTIKHSVTPNVAVKTQTMSVTDLLHVDVSNVSSTQAETNITETVSVTTTGVMKIVNSTRVTAQSSALAASVMEKTNATAVSLDTTISDDSSENPNSTHITYVSANNGGLDTIVPLMSENATSSVTVAGDHWPTNVTAVSNTPIKALTDSVNVLTHNGLVMTVKPSLVTVTQPVTTTEMVINQKAQIPVGHKAQRDASTVLSTLTAMKMVLVYVMMIGLKPILAQRNSDMAIAQYISENAGPTVAHATVQNSTTVQAVKSTEFSTMVYAHVTLTGSVRTVVNTTAHVTPTVTPVLAQTAMTVSTVSLTPTKTTQATVSVKDGTAMPTTITPASGLETNVSPGTENALLDVLHARTDTSQNNVQTVLKTPTSTNLAYVPAMLTGLASTVVNTSESVTHAVTDVPTTTTVLVTTVPSTPQMLEDSVSVMTAGPDLTAHSGNLSVTTSVTAAMTRLQLTELHQPTTTVYTV